MKPPNEIDVPIRDQEKDKEEGEEEEEEENGEKENTTNGNEKETPRDQNSSVSTPGWESLDDSATTTTGGTNPNGTSGSRNTGNTGTKSKSTGSTTRKRNKDRPSSNWCFTWNNYPENAHEIIRDLFLDQDKDISYVIYGREKGKEGTPHLQGFLQLHADKPMTAHDNPAGRFFQAHWSKARTIKNAREYCRKEDPNPIELGKFRPRAAYEGNRQGKRSDLDMFLEAVKEGGMTSKRARSEFPEVASRFPTYVEALISDYRPLPTVQEHPLYSWQHALWDRLENYEPCDREVIFIVDKKGNSGKTYFTKRFITAFPDNTQILNPGKNADLAYAYREETRVLFIDCPRAISQEYFQYPFIEYAKNGMVFSSKYQSGMKFNGGIHLVVFMNEEPDYTRLSRDRYNVIEIDEKLKATKPPPKEPQQEDQSQSSRTLEQQQGVATDPTYIETWEQLMEYKKIRAFANRFQQNAQGFHPPPKHPLGYK